MTNEELTIIEARAEAATPGPWIYDEERGRIVAHRDQARVIGPDSTRFGLAGDLADLELAAAARTDIPALVAEVRRLRNVYEQDTEFPCVEFPYVLYEASSKDHVQEVVG